MMFAAGCLAVATMGVATSADAGEAELWWEPCRLGEVRDGHFSCDSNDSTIYLTVAFKARPGKDSLFSVVASIRVSHESSAADWWGLDEPNGCRGGALLIEHVGGAPDGCLVPWIAADASHVIVSHSPTLTYLDVTAYVPDAVPLRPVTAGTWYRAFRIGIRGIKAVGAGSCGGCSVPAQISLVSLRIQHDLFTQDDYIISPTDPMQKLLWQGVAVPTVAKSWGEIRVLYR